MEPNTWIHQITFNRITISEVLTLLAKKLNYFWYVDYERDIHFFPKESEHERAPFDITDTSGNFIFDTLRVETDFTQIRNKVIVRGGEAVSNARTQLLSGTGDNKAFPLAYKFSELPTVTVGGVPQTVGVNGFDVGEGFDAIWDYNQKSLEFQDGSIPPAGTDNISVTGTPLLPVAVYVNDLPSQGLYGIIEHVVEDKRLISREDAIAFGNAELQAYKDPLYRVTFETYEMGLRSGQIIRVNSASREIDEELIIDSVTMTLDSENLPVWKVEANSYRTAKFVQMLQELFRAEDVDINTLETLYGIQEFSESVFVTDDEIVINVTVGPYFYGPTTGGNQPGVWNFSTWASGS